MALSLRPGKTVADTKQEIKPIKVLMEISSGSTEKTTFDEASKTQSLVYKLSLPMLPDVNYGSVRRTVSDDGDSLDCFVLSKDKINPGDEVEALPVAMISMKDERGDDDKIVAIDVRHLDKFDHGSYLKIAEALWNWTEKVKSATPDKWAILKGIEDAEAAQRRVQFSILIDSAQAAQKEVEESTHDFNAFYGVKRQQG